jgi:hypothetical protein
MSVLQKLTKALGCTERHVERLLAAKTPAGFYRRGERGRWRVRGPLTASRVDGIRAAWALRPPRKRRAKRGKPPAEFRDLLIPEAGPRRAAAAAFARYMATAPLEPDAAAEPEKFRDWWEMPIAEFARKYFPELLRRVVVERREIELETAVWTLKAEGVERPYRKQIAEKLQMPLRTYFKRYRPETCDAVMEGVSRELNETMLHEVSIELEEGRQNETKADKIVAALRELNGESDRLEDIARKLRISTDEFNRDYAEHLPEAYDRADQEFLAEKMPIESDQQQVERKAMIKKEKQTTMRLLSKGQKIRLPVASVES